MNRKLFATSKTSFNNHYKPPSFVILSIALLVMVCQHQMCFSASSWAKIEPGGTRNASDIDFYIATTNNEAVDRLLTNFRDNCALYYVSTTSIGVRAGSVVCSNTGGTLRKFRTNTAVTSNAPTLAASTTYYMYAIADADATTFTLEVVTSATVPTTGTYYKRLGSFATNSSSEILNDDSLINYNNYYALRLGDWVSKTVATVYQASTDGFVHAISNGGTAVSGYTDTSNPPTTLVAQDDSASTESGITMAVKRGDYWKVVGANKSLYWIPNELEV